MVYETSVRSAKELFEKLVDLAPDEGVRIMANYHGEDRLVFVTRHSGKYALWIRPVRQGRKSEDRTGEFKDFRDFRLLKKFLFGIIAEPLKAYVY